MSETDEMKNARAPKNPVFIGLVAGIVMAGYAVAFCIFTNITIDSEHYRKGLIGLELVGFLFSLFVFPKHNVNQFLFNVFVCMVFYTGSIALAATVFVMV